ncbi:hypothetical protein G4B88_003628 [Cannabis sativa]|uniref:Uncharacterized protein n=1 Tax=Cannabis sativa TaxID=3483 RepID=A0A7J6DJZ4_CANSA|nr:hypothetical protein G4B88_003628 [Cannabis sativa]
MDHQSCPQTTDDRDVMETIKKKKAKTVSCDDHNDCQRDEQEEVDCENDNDNDDDEGKIDKFFELITSFKEARNRLRKGVNVMSNNDDNSNEEIKMNERNTIAQTKKRKQSYDDNDINGGKTSWIPSFVREDFISGLEFRGIPSVFSTPNNNTSNIPNDQSHPRRKSQFINGLNLNLSLLLNGSDKNGPELGP